MARKVRRPGLSRTGKKFFKDRSHIKRNEWGSWVDDRTGQFQKSPLPIRWKDEKDGVWRDEKGRVVDKPTRHYWDKAGRVRAPSGNIAAYAESRPEHTMTAKMWDKLPSAVKDKLVQVYPDLRVIGKEPEALMPFDVESMTARVESDLIKYGSAYYEVDVEYEETEDVEIGVYDE